MPVVAMRKPDMPIIDLSHPLARGMTNCFVPLGHVANIKDLLRASVGTPAGAGTISLAASTLGQAPLFPGNAYYSLSKMLGRTTLPMSFAFAVTINSLAADNAIFKTVTNLAYSGIWVSLSATTGYVNVTVGDGSGSGSGDRRSTVSTIGMTINTTTHVAIVINTYSSHTIYINGIQSGVTTSGTGGSFGTTTAGGEIGRISDTVGTKYLTGLLHYLYVHSRRLTASEARQLSINPFAMFRVPQPLSRGNVASTTIRLAWSDNSEGEIGFSIERDDDGGGFIEIDTVAAGVETYDDAVDEGHTYTYRVRALSTALGDSEYSNETEVTV